MCARCNVRRTDVVVAMEQNRKTVRKIGISRESYLARRKMPCIIYRVGSLKNRRLNLNYALWQREPRTKRFKFYKRRRAPCCRAARLAVATLLRSRSEAELLIALKALPFVPFLLPFSSILKEEGARSERIAVIF